jgi:hypothetical protein
MDRMLHGGTTHKGGCGVSGGVSGVSGGGTDAAHSGIEVDRKYGIEDFQFELSYAW